MAKHQPVFVEDDVFKLQLALLDGIQSEDRLFAAGSLISRSDYQDAVTERSVANMCGYPLCHNALPVRPRKGRYRISLKEHKVYDLRETNMFCSSGCMVNSKAFAASLQKKRCSVLDQEKLNNVLRLFGNLNLEKLVYEAIQVFMGRDVSFHEEFLSVNEREYPRKIVFTDDQSSEIKQTLANCLARALPAVVAEIRLPIPISTLEQEMVCLLDTMSFTDALPSFRMKQWQVVVLLLLDALSVSRIPALVSYMTDRKDLFLKVLSGSQIGKEEYDVLKDLIVPLGRAPRISSQSGA